MTGLLVMTGAVSTLPAQEPRTVSIGEVRELIGKEPLVRVRGMVMFETAPGFLFLQDESSHTRVILSKPVPLEQGDMVEVTGVPTKHADHSWLTSATAVRLGERSVPTAKRLRGDEIADHDAEYVSVRAKIIGQTTHSSGYNVEGRRYTLTLDVLIAEADGASFKVMFHQGHHVDFLYPAGTDAVFTGVVRGKGEFGDSEAFETHVLVTGPEAVKVISKPPFWTTHAFARLLEFAGAAVLCVAAAVGIWIVLQRRRLRHLQKAEENLRRQNVELERRVAERAAELAESEAKYRTLFESNSCAVLIHDDQQVLDCNPAALSVFGYKREQLIGRHPGTLSPPTQPGGQNAMELAMWHLQQALAKGTHQFEWISVRGDGTPVPVEIVLTPTQLNGRPVLQALVQDISKRKESEAALQRDISERQRVQKELERALAREREVSDLRANFVSLVSHEFRTPLEVILTSADILRRYYGRLSPEKREAYLQTIHDSVKRMGGMMEDVLLLGRVEEGKLQFKPEPLDLAAFCSRVADELLSATTQRCSIRVQFDGDLGGACADESLLRHILVNLLSNATKYSDAGAPVSLLISRRDEDAVITIADRGRGIPAADQERLFQSFQRGSNVSDTPGTGLGLLIVKKCVEIHCGAIAFESSEGSGTTFTVTLPLFKTSTPQPGIASS